MRCARTIKALVLAAALAAGLASPSRAERITVMPGEDLDAVLARAAQGDEVVLAAGEHKGGVRLDKRLTLQGEPGAVLQGPREGSVVTVLAPEAVVRGLTIRGSGMDLEKMDSGVFIEKSATRARVEGNRIEGNLYGVYVHGPEDALVRKNIILGISNAGRINESGNGVSVWDAPGSKVIDNDFSFGRDGIFSVASRKNIFARNRFSNLRFAVHYMYTNESEVTDNISIGNTAGYAIMYSNRLIVRGNVSDGDRDRGFLFNFANGSAIEGNVVMGRRQPAERWASRGSRTAQAREHGLATPGESSTHTEAKGARIGPEKCVFIYNSNQNQFRGNWFEGCEVGIHFTAGSERNEITGNAFIGNRNQVKYVGTRFLDWSKDGRGNYWSDNPGFDLNGDGIADTAYRPNDLIDTVLWTAPQAKLLVNSPAVQVIRWAQAQFPALLPGGVVDTRPLISPPPRPALAGGAKP